MLSSCRTKQRIGRRRHPAHSGGQNNEAPSRWSSVHHPETLFLFFQKSPLFPCYCGSLQKIRGTEVNSREARFPFVRRLIVRSSIIDTRRCLCTWCRRNMSSCPTAAWCTRREDWVFLYKQRRSQAAVWYYKWKHMRLIKMNLHVHVSSCTGARIYIYKAVYVTVLGGEVTQFRP